MFCGVLSLGALSSHFQICISSHSTKFYQCQILQDFHGLVVKWVKPQFGQRPESLDFIHYSEQLVMTKKVRRLQNKFYQSTE